jgi:hypothetical protein
MTALPPIPSHLPAWQGPHLAWLAAQGHPTFYAVPDGTEPYRADLTGAYLYGADLTGADLSGAVLSGADLSGAVLCHARGIASIGPIGRHGRSVYAVAHDDGPRIQAGCWWGSVDDTIVRIEDDYADDHAARDRYVSAVRLAAALVTP